MKDYKRYGKCQVCGVDLKQDDDIVVCPDCGAPYHRACYETCKNCVYLDRHGTDFTYLNTVTDNTKKNDKKLISSKTNMCPRCFNENPATARFCSKCGLSLSKNEIPQTFSMPVDPLLDPLYGFNKDDTIDGIKISEFSQYIKSNLFYYVSLFKSIHEKNRSRFNFCAFLFSGGWFLYRKLYKIGAVITTTLMFLMISSSLIEYIYIPQILAPILKSIGATSMTTFTINKSNELLAQVLLLPATQQLLLIAPSVIKIIQFAIMLTSGFVANRVYFKDCCSKIRKIKILCKDDSKLFEEKMDKHGGTNSKVVMLLIVCYLIIEYLPGFLV